MFWQRILETLAQTLVVTSVLIFSISLTLAQVRTSPSYQIQSDSINVGGGLSSSTNYIQESTVGEIATGRSTSTSYQLRAGYQQMQEVFISLSLSSSSLTMSPALPGLTGGESSGSTTATVVTDSSGGYQLTITAATAPAMQKGSDTIADYVPLVVGVPDYTFTTDTTEAHFAFSPEGADIVDLFIDDGATCNSAGGDTPLRCWLGLSTSATVLARGTGANHPEGATTTIQFKVGVGSSVGVVPGFYVATTTITALPL